MKRVKRIVFVLVLIAITLPSAISQTAPREIVVSQDTSIVIPVPDPLPTDEGIVGIFSWLLRNWDRILGVLAALIMVFEIAVSWIPTKTDWSLLLKIRKILDGLKLINWLTRNRASGGGTFNATSIKQP